MNPTFAILEFCVQFVHPVCEINENLIERKDTLLLSHKLPYQLICAPYYANVEKLNMPLPLT